MSDGNSKQEKSHHTVQGVFGHILALIAGAFLMLVGISLSVTMVMLPIGVPVAIVGLICFSWGLSEFIRLQKVRKV